MQINNYFKNNDYTAVSIFVTFIDVEGIRLRSFNKSYNFSKS